MLREKVHKSMFFIMINDKLNNQISDKMVAFVPLIDKNDFSDILVTF